jgi:hypothetical protein
MPKFLFVKVFGASEKSPIILGESSEKGVEIQTIIKIVK